MQKNILIYICLLATFVAYGQINLEPIEEITYGNRNHTNRDYLQQTLVDQTGNLYLLGTTENDFTFNDLKIIKLNNNLELSWAVTKSFDEGISYENVLGGHIDSNNDLVLVCRTAFTSANQSFVVLKYNSNGSLLWEYEVAPLEDRIDHEWFSHHSFLDSSDNLRLMYRPRDQDVFEYYFLSLSPSGEKIDEYSKTDQFIAADGLLNPYKILNHQGFYYMLMLDELDQEPWQKFTFHKFDKTINESIELPLDAVETDYFKQSFAEFWSVMRRDLNNNYILITPDYSLRKDYGILSFTSTGTINYRLLPDDITDRYLLESGFDTNNNLMIISNNRLTGSSDPLALTLQKYDEDGTLVSEVSRSHIGQFTTISDGKITTVTTENKLVSYDFDFNLIDEVELNEITTLQFEINDIKTVGPNYFYTGSTLDINYPGSVLYSEIDMVAKKISPTAELSSYRFSGLGTSKIFRKKEIIPQDTAFVVALTEKLGPDNFSPAGSVSPEQQRFLTFKKEDLTLQEDKIVPLDEDLLTPYNPQGLSTLYTDSNGDQFEYRISNDTTAVSLFKNNSVQWTRNLDFYIDPLGDPITNDNEQIFEWKVNEKGDFYLTSYIYGLQKCTLHRYTLDNEYSFIEPDELLVMALPMQNHWVFSMTSSGKIIIYSDRLTTINELQSNYTDLYQNNYYSKTKNNQVLLHKHGDQYLHRYNQFGELQSTYFEVTSFLGPSSTIEYNDNFLLVLEQIGSSIYLEPQYSWNLATMKLYDLDQSDSFDPFIVADDDNDGVNNDLDECRNTPSDETADSFGCSESQTLSDDDFLSNTFQLYPNPSNGLLNVSFNGSFTVESAVIYDRLGKPIVTNAQGLIQTGRLDLQYLNEGIYFVKVAFDNGSLLSRKIIISR